MEFTTLGRTGLRVSVAGLGCGGHSRLGRNTGRTEAESVALVRLALDEGMNLIDTAANYGTEEIVGKALAGVPRDAVVVATKCSLREGSAAKGAAEVVRSLHDSLRRLRLEHVDVFQIHGLTEAEYGRATGEIIPALRREQEAGRFRFLGVTEHASHDLAHATLLRAVEDGVFETAMVAFNMLHRTAADALFARTKAAGVGTLIMHAVRSIFAHPGELREALREQAAAGRLDRDAAEEAMGFLVHPGGAADLTDAAYRFARHEPGADVVLFGTGSPDHLRANIASLLRPPLPAADRARLLDVFARVSGLGLEAPRTAKAA